MSVVVRVILGFAVLWAAFVMLVGLQQARGAVQKKVGAFLRERVTGRTASLLDAVWRVVIWVLKAVIILGVLALAVVICYELGTWVLALLLALE